MHSNIPPFAHLAPSRQVAGVVQEHSQEQFLRPFVAVAVLVPEQPAVDAVAAEGVVDAADGAVATVAAEFVAVDADVA